MRSDELVFEHFIWVETFLDLPCETLNLTRLCLDARAPSDESPLKSICDRMPKLKILVIINVSEDPIGITPIFSACPNLTELELYFINITETHCELFRHLTKLKKLSLSLSNLRSLSKKVCCALGRSLRSTQIECVEFSVCGSAMTFDLIQNLLDHVNLPCLKALDLTDHQFDQFSERLRTLSNTKSFLLSGQQSVNVNGKFVSLSSDCCDHFFQWDDLTYFYE